MLQEQQDSLKKMWSVSARLGISSNHVEAMVAPLTANVYITRHAALNSIPRMCQTISDFQQCPWEISSVW